MKHEIIEVLPESIADELEISPGDILLRINGKKIKDVIDYRFAVQSEELTIEIEKPYNEGNPRKPAETNFGRSDDFPRLPEIWELEIEKDADEDLGLVFKHALMSETRRCRNKCVFCFVDQQPSGLRKSLYIKDDDARLSFLMGNYVTLTNLSQREIERIANYHLSPLRISVHTTDPSLRKKMMNCDAAENLNEALKIFGDAGIKMHFQVVLCKGINDGENLSRTIETLCAQKGAESLAIVPAGITRHRDGLFPLEPFTPKEAEKVIAQIKKLQENCRRATGKTFVFAADEWYIMADKTLPKYNHYEDFPQLDNGVGMLRLFEKEFISALFLNTTSATNMDHWLPKHKKTFEIGIITGKAAKSFIHGLLLEFQRTHPKAKITIYAINNNFFGENITVSGLLTGTDIIAQLKNRITAKVLFIPENAFRTSSEDMLDGTTLKSLTDELGIPIIIGNSDGRLFYQQIYDALMEPRR